MIRHLSIMLDRFLICDTQRYEALRSATQRYAVTGINRLQGSVVPDIAYILYYS